MPQQEKFEQSESQQLLEEMSIETSKTEMQREKEWKNRTEYPRTEEQLQKEGQFQNKLFLTYV